MFLAYLLICHFTVKNDQPSCELNPHEYNYNFMVWTLSPFLALSVLNYVLIKNEVKFLTSFIIVNILMNLAYTYYVIYGFLYLFDGDCWSGFHLQFINSVAIMLLGFKPAILVSVLLAIFVCCLPCICCLIVGIAKERGRTEQLKAAVINNIVKTKFDHTDLAFKNDECAICLC